MYMATMGRLGAAVAGTEVRVLLVAIPNSQLQKRRLQMNKFRFTIKMLAIATFLLAFASLAQAQASRTWVSGVGDDANPCSRTAPCKTFAGATSKTAAGGEIDALDPGGFGAVTITKALTIDGGGGQVASVLVSSGNGIVVQAGVGDYVTLTNLRIQGLRQATGSTSLSGIRFTQGAGLNVVNCYIWNFGANGIDIALNQSQNATVFVLESTVKNCAGDGISVLNSGTGLAKTEIQRSSFVENGNGLHAKGKAVVSARNCDFSLSNSNGVFVDGATANAVVHVWQSMVTGNINNGFLVGNGGAQSGLFIAQNQIDRNGLFGVTTGTGGGVSTFGNNSILGNGTDGCAGCTPVGPGN
jgi:hypothetical protein